MRVASLGGGPGYELLALEWFMRYWAHTSKMSSLERRRWLAAAQFDGGRTEDTEGSCDAGDTTGGTSSVPLELVRRVIGSALLCCNGRPTFACAAGKP